MKNTLKVIPKMAGFASPRLGIRFQLGRGPNNLVIIRPDGTRFLTYVELADRLEDADRRAEEQAQLVQAERQRAEEQAQLVQTERERADRMAARLRELGIEPD